MGEIIFDDEIPYGDEIRLNGGWVDFISSASADFIRACSDFIALCAISLKECYETEYWIEIAQKAELISKDVAKTVLHDCGSIRRILIASINIAKENKS